MDYHDGEHVVYPPYGVGMVTGVAKKKFAGTTEKCLGIQSGQRHRSLFIPIHRLEKVRLRKVMSKSTATRVISQLKTRARYDVSQSHKDRLKHYQVMFNTGEPMEMAAVARDLARLSKKQELSMEEEGLCRESIGMLSHEIAISRNKETKAVRDNIEKLLYR